LLKGVVVESLGERRGGDVIGVAEARWKAIEQPGLAAAGASPINDKESSKIEEDVLEGS